MRIGFHTSILIMYFLMIIILYNLDKVKQFKNRKLFYCKMEFYDQNNEDVLIDNVMVCHYLMRMNQDSCSLFNALAYHVYNNVQMGLKVRWKIVQCVSTNWIKYKLFWPNSDGLSYNRCEEYVTEMSKPSTFGTICELTAAGEIFQYQFQVYRNNKILCTFGSVGTVARLKLTGHLFSQGHFDVLISNNVYPPGKPNILNH